ncbi:hypothetical protein QJQ45_004943 [Haematococcus lacustris]|nr:hypothetical protein QJQ45_004943 [Haematococcus lacustris]
MAGQALGTVTNDPRAHEPKSWFGWGRSDLSRAGPPPALDPNKYPNIKRKDLEPYLRVIRGAHQHFLQDRESLAEANNRQALLDGFEPGSVPGKQPLSLSQSSQGSSGAASVLVCGCVQARQWLAIRGMDWLRRCRGCLLSSSKKIFQWKRELSPASGTLSMTWTLAPLDTVVAVHQLFALLSSFAAATAAAAAAAAGPGTAGGASSSSSSTITTTTTTATTSTTTTAQDDKDVLSHTS